MSFIETVASSLGGNEQSITIELSGTGSALVAKITPHLGAVPTKATEKEAMLHAALSTPLLVKGSAQEIEHDILERFKPYQASRNNDAPELEAIRNATAKAETSNTEGKKTSTPSTDSASSDMSSTVGKSSEVESAFDKKDDQF